MSGGSVAVSLSLSARRMVVCLAVCVAYWPLVSQAQSLTDELRGVVSAYPSINSKEKSVEAAAALTDVARSGYFPQVKLTADTGPEYTDSVDRLNTQGKPFMRGTTHQSAMTVTQNLYNGSATSAAVGGARAGELVSQAGLKKIRQDTLLAGARAYLEVLRDTHLIRLALENVHTVQDQLNLEDERIAKGAGMSLDALTAKQQLQTAKEARVRFDGNLRTALATYQQIFGHAPNIPEMTEPVAPLALLTPTMEDALDTAEKNNPAIEAAFHTITQKSEARRKAEAGYMPSLDLVGKSDFMHDKSASTGDRKDWSILLQVSWDLFSGWSTQSQVAQASAEHGAAMDDHRQAVYTTDETVRKMWESLSTDQESMVLLENAASLAEEMVEATRKLHAAGKETIFNVLDSQNRLNDARIRYAGAYYDMVEASFDVLNAMGQLELEAIERSQTGPGASLVRPPEFLSAHP